MCVSRQQKRLADGLAALDDVSTDVTNAVSASRCLAGIEPARVAATLEASYRESRRRTIIRRVAAERFARAPYRETRVVLSRRRRDGAPARVRLHARARAPRRLGPRRALNQLVSGADRSRLTAAHSRGRGGGRAGRGRVGLVQRRRHRRHRPARCSRRRGQTGALRLSTRRG